MDDDVARLVREERLVEAAELAASRGDAGAASALFERACLWGRAAHEAWRAGDPGRALGLAVLAGDEALANATLPSFRADPALAVRVAGDLMARREHAWAARLLEGVGQARDAARAWELAGDPARAARSYEAASEPALAARALEAGLRKEPGRADLLLALGDLLLRYGKVEAAVRALQKVPADAPERREALVRLVHAFEQLGLVQAERDARGELASLGEPPSSAEAPPPAPVTQPPPMRLYGRYDFVREVASSPTARVLECVDVVRGERVAMKLFVGHELHGTGRDALARFEREVRVLGALDHPNVVPLRDYVPEGPAIVLAWMNGGTLEAQLMAGPMVPARAVDIARATLAALEEAHHLGVLHRDVKPSNVLFDDAGTPRLADFGVAHLGDLSTTATAGIIGTLAYMSPEQRQGRAATVQSDIYSVGVMLREMLTGEHPSPEAAPVLRPSDVHRRLDARHDAIVLRLADPDPNARPADAREARQWLLSVAWPDTLDVALDRPELGRTADGDKIHSGRLAIGDAGQAYDRWLDRPVERVALTDAVLARASAFARAGAPALQGIQRVDREASELWLEPARGRPPEAPLDGRQRRDLEEALRALHAAGIVHGAVDRDHVRVDDEGEVTLCFTPASDPAWTFDRDWAALARL